MSTLKPTPIVGPGAAERRAAARRLRLPVLMTLAEAENIAGRLGKPSKMPGYSYGLSAFLCRKGGEMSLVPGSVCYGCYAQTDFYVINPFVAQGQVRRHVGLEDPRWPDAMVRLIESYCRPPNNWFRWHDSGDLQKIHGEPDGAAHLALIVEVCERTPQVNHWLPTREYGDVAAFLAAGGRIPENLALRLSGLMVDQAPELPAELADLPTSTVHTPGRPLPVIGKGSIECRAIELRENECGECRACWEPRVRNVSYPLHLGSGLRERRDRSAIADVVRSKPAPRAARPPAAKRGPAPGGRYQCGRCRELGLSGVGHNRRTCPHLERPPAPAAAAPPMRAPDRASTPMSGVVFF